MDADERPIMAWARRAALALALALGGFLALPGQSRADSFFFGYSSGGWHRPYHKPYYKRHHRTYYRPFYKSYHRPFFRPRHFGPRVTFFGPTVYVPPPPRVVYAPPRRVYAPAPTGRVIRANPASEPYRTQSGLMCREYQTTVEVAGGVQNAYGTACLQPDGAWRIVD